MAMEFNNVEKEKKEKLQNAAEYEITNSWRKKIEWLLNLIDSIQQFELKHTNVSAAIFIPFGVCPTMAPSTSVCNKVSQTVIFSSSRII